MVLTAFLEVESRYLTRTGREVFLRQDNNITGQDGKCNRQGIEIQDRTVSNWAEPRSGLRVVEGQ